MVVGALEGPALGLLWAIRPPRMTISWLMIVVAVVGLMLGLFVYDPLFGLIALTVPITMAVPIKLTDILVRYNSRSK